MPKHVMKKKSKATAYVAKKTTKATRKAYVKSKGKQATRTHNTLIQGRAGQVSFTKSSHKHYASADVKQAKQIGAPSLISRSTYNSMAVKSGTQNTLVSQNFTYQDMSELLNTVITGAFVAGQGPARAVVKGLVEEYILTNATNAGVEVDIYDIVCKRDIPFNLTFNANSYIYGAVPSPDAYWATGLNAQQNLNPGTGMLPDPQPFQMLTTKPTDSHLFNDYFRITKKCRVMMAAGASHKHLLNISVNKYIDQYLTNAQTAGLKGYSTYTMFVVAGMPLQVVGGDSTYISTSSVAINMVRSQRIKYVWVADSNYTSLCATNLPFNVAPTNQLLINPVNGTADNIITK